MGQKNIERYFRNIKDYLQEEIYRLEKGIESDQKLKVGFSYQFGGCGDNNDEEFVM